MSGPFPRPWLSREMPGGLVALACLVFAVWSFLIDAELQAWIVMFGAGPLIRLVNWLTGADRVS